MQSNKYSIEPLPFESVCIAIPIEVLWLESNSEDLHELRQTHHSTMAMRLLDHRLFIFRCCSTEAEYVTLSVRVQEILWARALLDKLDAKQGGPTIVRIDDQAAIAIAQNTGYQPHMKNIGMRKHFARERAASGDMG